MENVADIYPLAPAQEGMLFHTLAAPGSGVYVEQYGCTLAGALQTDRFRQAWQHAVERHPVLRTAFLWEGLDDPLQVVRHQVALPWTEHDWRDAAAAEIVRRMAAFLVEDRTRGFDPMHAPLMRMALFRTGAETHRFVWTFHHLLLDGWSTALVLKEVLADYAARCHGRTAALTAPRPFREYLSWYLAQDLEAAERFWSAYLHGFATPTPLPIDQAAASDPASGYARLHRDLSADQTAALRTVAQQHRLTLNTLVQGAWALLLNRYSGEKDVVYGTTVSGRPAALRGVEAMVGSFINTLPVRVPVKPKAVLSTWLQNLQANLTDLRHYEYTPLAKIQQWSPVRGERALFDSLVVFENYPLDDETPAREAGLVVRDVAYLEQSNYPLALLVLPGPQLRLLAVYDTSRFSEAAIERLLGHVATLLAGMAQMPQGRLDALPLIPAEERERLIEQGSTAELPVSESTLPALIAYQAAKTPDAAAVCFDDEVLSYAALNAWADQVAQRLSARDVGAHDYVGLFVERSPEMIVGILAILKASAAYVPLDPAYPDERLRYILTDAGVRVVLTVSRAAERVPTGPAAVVCIDEPLADEGPAPAPSTARADPAGPAYVIYTSGSTGKPKGTAVTHRNVVYATQARLAYYPTPPTCFLLLSPVGFDSSVAGIFWTLVTGGTLVLPRPGDEREVRHLAALIRRHGVSHTLCVPALYELLLTHTPLDHLLSLRTVIVAGEACPPALPRLHFDRLPETALYNEYGPTETTVWATVHRVRADEDPETVPIGRPIPGAQVYVLDRHRRPVPLGVPGELYIGGPGVTPGYLNRPDLTADRFIPDPFADTPGGRVYRTGDRVRYRDDGALEFLGRIDQQVKLRGHRIEIGEIEAVLLRHQAIREGAVALREVDGTPHLVAYVVLAASAAVLEHLEEGPALRDLRQILRRQLPEYMVPTYIEFLQALPRTPNGKVDRGALPMPAQRHTVAAADFVAPEDPLELQMIELWQDILDVQPLSMTDDFFDLGGHSLLAVTLVMRMEDMFGTAVPLSALVEHPTPQALVALLRADLPETGSASPVPMRAQGARPPLFCVPGSGGYPILFYKLASYLRTDQPVYAFEPQGVDGRALPLTTIEAMAAQHVQELRRVQKTGPYHLCGYSVGGLVAFEMAQQLHRAGETVALLALLDTQLYSSASANGRSTWAMVRTRAQAVRQRVRDDVRYWLTRREARAYVQRNQVMPKALRNSFPAKVHERAARRYVPYPYPGSAYLFSAIDSPKHTETNRQAWSALIGGDLEVHEIAAGHSLVQEPFVGELARFLTQCLDSIQASVEELLPTQ